MKLITKTWWLKLGLRGILYDVGLQAAPDEFTSSFMFLLSTMGVCLILLKFMLCYVMFFG